MINHATPDSRDHRRQISGRIGAWSIRTDSASWRAVLELFLRM